jgi:type IX secretion system PorP/SprF family membrane protein
MGSYAQQDPQFTQFMFNKLTYNPGFAGYDNKICATGLYRTQWVGFGSSEKGNSPVTFLGNISAPLGEKFGVGLNFTNDKLGFTNNLGAIASFAYKHKFKGDDILSAGLGLGFFQQSLDGAKLKPLETGDAKIPTTSVSGNTFDMSLGVTYSRPQLWIFDNFYAGLSATHLNQGKVQYSWASNTSQFQLKLHYYLITGAVYNLNSSFAIEPNILVKRDPAKWITDFNAYVMYNNKLRGGLSYRTIDAVSLLLGYRFTPDLQIGYSYDLTTTKILSFSNGSHEIMLRYCFMPKLKEKPEKPPIPRLTPRFL